MIAYLEGSLAEKSPTHAVVLVGGVGYKLFIPVSTFYVLPEEGQTISLRVHTHVREDVLALYGFSSPVEEYLFQRLISVASVGPALALKILSGLEPEALVEAIRRGDLRRLNAIPGVGRKTAERLVLELRDKMPEVSARALDAAASGSAETSSLSDDLLSALLNLGFPRAQAEKEVAAVVSGDREAPFEKALKSVLKRLSG